ncbi:MAG: hypothetical protein Q7R90_03335 [bacterium]|nr:hypothetical protein [bacterium]
MDKTGSTGRPTQSGGGTKYVCHQNGVAGKGIDKRDADRTGRGMPGNWPSNQGQPATTPEVARVS